MKVRPVQNVLGLKAGVVSDVEDSTALRTAIKAGKVEKVSATAAKKAAAADDGLPEAAPARAAHGAGDTR